MAPSRRKCAIKATPAAVRPKWEVGDLVLAKVKGFPAWPATVSEPQKWGCPADLKKVLVYFFGTQQIAFCNPADVEEFTEEKKVSVLGKCHGKGSDFVRALREIIDCFEKLKEQDQATSDNLTDETTITNENNSDESLTKSVNDEAPAITVKQLSIGATNDLNSLTEAAVAVVADDALLDEEMQLKEAQSNLGFTEIRVYSTSKTDAAQSRKVGAQRRVSSRRLRSSSRIDAGARQTSSMLPYTNNTRSFRWLGTNALQDRSLRRNIRIMKSFGDSEGHNVNAPVFVSNDSIEENDSEVMTVDSDTLSYNDVSSVDSGCKPVEEEIFNEINEGEPELGDRLDFQPNANIIKKKRKPNRKRHRNDIVPGAKLDDVISESKVWKTECVSPRHNKKVAKSYVKENGDEHLPLVKRGRARMGRPSSAVDEEGTSVHEEEKTLKVSESFAVQSSGPLTCNVVPPAVGESVPNRGGLGNSHLLHASPARKYQSWETRKNFVDGEAALPPSKRLRRALEAMSANVAEDTQRASSSPIVNDRANGCCSSSSAQCSEPSIREEAAIGLGSALVEDHTSDDSQSSAREFCVGLNMEVPENDDKAFVMVSDSGKTSLCTDSPNPEFCEDSLEHAQGADSKRLKLSPLNERLALSDHSVETDTEHQHGIPDSPTTGGKLSQSNCNPPCLMMSLDDCKVEPSESMEAAKRSDPDSSQMNSGSVFVEEISCGSPNTITAKGIQIDGLNGGGDETHKEKHLCLSEDNQDSWRSEFVGEARPASTDLNIVPSATPVKVLASGLHSTSVSDDHLEDRVASVTQSLNLTDGSDSVARASPRCSSMSNISASNNNSYVGKNNSCSNVQLHPGKAKLTGKSSSNHKLMSSFEAIIRSLTRTKESIGRATQIAIDCAKFGFATKVVEILARNLESESSPHKKVDLFFLVDSITQCSGGMKGDAGIYPSAIQLVLPRLLLAAAPPGSSFHENHRQYLKVLRLWLDRKILPEPIICHHIRELDALYGSHVTSGSRRSSRFERPFDDPIREMESMLVDEYGSNSSIQLPGFCMPRLLRDDDIGSDSDGESFEAVTPVHNVENLNEEMNLIAVVEKRSRLLEDVDGELEMEDVAPSCEAEITSTSNIARTNCTRTSHHQSDNHYGAPFSAQQPKDTQLISAPPPPSPPPPPPPPPLPPSGFPHAVLDSVSNVPDSALYPSSQEPGAKQSCSRRVKPRPLDAVRHHRVHENKYYGAHLPRQMRYCSNACPPSDQPTSHFSGRTFNGFQPVDGCKGFHLHPLSPAPSSQFSYVRERRIQSWKDIPPPPHANRSHTRNAENGNFYRKRDRNKFARRDNIGEYWRPPLPSISGLYYHDSSRMAHAPMLHNGPPHEPAVPDNRLKFPPRSMYHRQFRPYRPPFYEGPIPVADRGLSSALYIWSEVNYLPPILHMDYLW